MEEDVLSRHRIFVCLRMQLHLGVDSTRSSDLELVLPS